jgi:hypothetical protein
MMDNQKGYLINTGKKSIMSPAKLQAIASMMVSANDIFCFQHQPGVGAGASDLEDRRHSARRDQCHGTAGTLG